ncbi:alpha/beta-hydrolase [Dothidotthia symphoricarpi CBS 119687]|uniref:Alpha/beta-hydrolase n=1 Tax=Dothidotthia symphoricarpi CBS 119687 TaxID=1392245 RepID=A0A6A6AI48_9PLEO|nr:alpha/beta-hydrolase [Dothidotthia symphoricarpi CBS 119687]KAF2130775.1 alpha/beta-hydrolase [Dothidotthia symphoricarpi CBS 119687]
MTSLPKPLRVPYKTVQNVDLPTDIYVPEQSSKFAPVLIMIHGGAFMLGSSDLNNKDQIQDCLERGWVVLGIEHRLCPGVNVLEGPITDVRDVLKWTQNGGLAKALKDNGNKVVPDEERVVVMGTSSGGHLALSTAWDVPKRPLAILDFYGAKHFRDPFWYETLDSLPEHFREPRPEGEIEGLYNEKTTFVGGLSLEGQAADPSAPNPKTRQAFAMHQISTGKVIKTIWPQTPDNLQLIDPVLNVNKDWPPVAIVHGTADKMVLMRLSKELESQLIAQGVETEFIEVEGEPHTFAGSMKKGSKTWDTQRKGFDFLEKIITTSYNS